MFKRYVLMCVCLGLTGCGTIKKQWDEFAPDRDGEYLEATTSPSLTMPSGMAMNKAYLSDPYPVPKGPLPPAGAEPVDIFPPTLKKELADDTESDAADAS